MSTAHTPYTSSKQSRDNGKRFQGWANKTPWNYQRSSPTTNAVRFDLVGPAALQKKTNIPKRDRTLCVNDSVAWNPV